MHLVIYGRRVFHVNMRCRRDLIFDRVDAIGQSYRYFVNFVIYGHYLALEQTIIHHLGDTWIVQRVRF